MAIILGTTDRDVKLKAEMNLQNKIPAGAR